MADKNLELGLRIKADLEEGRKEVQGLTEAVNDVAEAVTDASEITSEFAEETETLADELNAASKSADTSAAAITDVANAAKKSQANTRSLGDETKKLAKEQAEQERRLVELLRVYDKTETELRALDAAVEDITRAHKEGRISAEQYARAMGNISKEREQLELTAAGWGKVEGRIKGAVAALAGGAIFRAVISNTTEAERAQARLGAVLRATGESVGFNREQLIAMSETVSDLTGVQERDIQGAQTRLLTYTQVVGENYPRALQAAIDMAEVMGMSVDSAAESVGKAIDKPSQGLSALTEQGFRFTEQQKKQVEALEKSGRVADAQIIILEELESVYQGTASAARDTFGGALQSLSNTLQDLAALDGTDEQVKDATAAINELITLLKSPETKNTVATFTGLFIGAATGIVNFATELKNLGNQIALSAANMTGNLLPVDKIQAEIDTIDRALKGGLSTPLMFIGTSDDELQSMRAALVLQKELIEQQSLLSRPNTAPSTPSTNTKADVAIVNEEYEKLLANLRKNLAIQVDNTEVAKVRYAIENNLLGELDESMRKMLLTEAERIDKAKTNQKADEERKRATEQLIKRQGDYVNSLEKQAAVVGLNEEQLRNYENAERGLTGALLERARAAQTIIAQEKDKLTLADLNIQLLRAQGNEQRAVQLEFEAKYGEMLERLKARGDTAGVEIISKIINLNELDRQLAGVESAFDKSMETMARQETSINTQREAGLISEYEARQKILQLHRETYAELEKQRPVLEELAKQPGAVGEAASKALADLNAQGERLLATTSLLEQTLKNSLESGLTDAIMGLADGTKSFGDAIKSLGASVASALAQMAAQALAQQMVGAMFGAAGGGGGWMSIAASAASSYSEGGYTGDGGKYEAAGIVHKGEGVLSQKDIAALGGPAGFYALQSSLRGYADGGLVGVPAPAMPSPTMGSSSLAEPAAMNATLENQQNFYLIDSPERTADMMKSKAGIEAIKIILRNEPGEFKALLGVN